MYIYIYLYIFIYIYIYPYQETAYAELRVDSGAVDSRRQCRLRVALEVVIVHESFCITEGVPEGRCVRSGSRVATGSAIYYNEIDQ